MPNANSKRHTHLIMSHPGDLKTDQLFTGRYVRYEESILSELERHNEQCQATGFIQCAFAGKIFKPKWRS